MAKTEVYSWRLSVETKSRLEEISRQHQLRMSDLLDRIVSEWLARQQLLDDDEFKQQRLHAAASKAIGTIRGDDPGRASNARSLLRTGLAKRRADQGSG